MPVGCITAGPKSVARTMGAASLRHGTIASANKTPLPRFKAPLSFVKRRYTKCQNFTFYFFKVGRFASESVIMNSVSSKCLPVLL